MTTSDFIAAGSLLVALSTMVFYLLDRRHQKHKILHDYINHLLQWHGDTVSVLLRLRTATQTGGTTTELLAELSTQIEKGRFYFPNVDKGDNFGKQKPVAYQGYRNLAIDFLVYSYNLYSKENAKSYLRHAERLQREFTSLLIRIVRPRENLAAIRRLTDRYLADDKIFEDFLSQDPASIQFMNPS